MKLAKLKKNGRLKIDRNNRVEPLVDAIIQNGKILSANPSPIKLDLGCGPNKKAGFIGVDQIQFPGVDVVMDLNKPWPWPDNSVEEAHSSHFLEHLEAQERFYFFNELWRVLKPNSKATIITPDWSSCRAYGDLTHKWPPVSEFFWYYLYKPWRMANAPHDDADHFPGRFKCNFDVQGGHSFHPDVAVRSPEYQAFASTFYKESRQDMIATLTAIK